MKEKQPPSIPAEDPPVASDIAERKDPVSVQVPESAAQPSKSTTNQEPLYWDDPESLIGSSAAPGSTEPGAEPPVPAPASEKPAAAPVGWVEKLKSVRLTRRAKIALISVGAVLAVLFSVGLYLTIQLDSMLRTSIVEKGKERGMDIKFSDLKASGVLPWQFGQPKVVLKNVTLKSDEAPNVDIQVDELVVPLKGTFPSYEPGNVVAKKATLSSPDIPSLIALEKSAKTGKASKTTATVEDVTVTITRVSKSLPVTVIGRAKRIDVAKGKVDLQGVTLEVPVPFGDVKLGPVSAQVERADEMTWARFDELDSARLGVKDDVSQAKLIAEKVDAQGVGKKLGLDLPKMVVTGDLDANMKADAPMTGSFSLVLDGYVPPHPTELNGILHDKKTKVTGKLRHTEAAIFFDDLVLESGGLKLKGKGRLDWTEGGMLHLDLAGNVACSALATSAVGSRLGDLAGAITGELAGGRVSGTVGVSVTVVGKITEFRKLNFNPQATFNCGVNL